MCVVILKFGSSMHDAKARVHRLEVGSLLVVGSKEGNSTRKCWQKRKKGKIRQIRVATVSIKSKGCDAMQCYDSCLG